MIQSATYIGSFNKESECPKAEIPEFAFIGRSNVGKSSLINMVTNMKGLAKTSQTPGKTQKINIFLIDKAWHLVDLPGYGYAKVSKTMRSDFDKMIRHFLTKRETLYAVFTLVDASIPPQKLDLEFISWLGENRIPFIIVFTKIDKAKSIEINKNIQKFNEIMMESWNELPMEFKTSSEKFIGQRELFKFIQDTLKQES
ncbi:MAG: YihA family ribosome biogenesis GTP-binding protein [Sphingobacteriales bacterium]|jgi:GTP-binding protein|nr:MAG: YihA family ribosome biogenesis GTP-binding protein [Sphingobacteriales bacterium]